MADRPPAWSQADRPEAVETFGWRKNGARNKFKQLHHSNFILESRLERSKGVRWLAYMLAKLDSPLAVQ